MRRPDEGRSALGWLIGIGLALLGALWALGLLSGCAALADAAPVLLRTAGDVLEEELQQAREERRQAELLEAQRLLREIRAAHAAAQDAARHATEAALAAEMDAERAARAREDAERARAERLLVDLRAKIVRLGLAPRIEREAWQERDGGGGGE